MDAVSNVMAGKRGLVMGVANERSIAWGIAKTAAEHGAKLAFTYQGDALLKRLEPLARSVGSNTIMQCDVTEDRSIEDTFASVRQKWGKLDFLVTQ
jgi:enoyl-[acyl-carrier protein] reductase I